MLSISWFVRYVCVCLCCGSVSRDCSYTCELAGVPLFLDVNKLCAFMYFICFVIAVISVNCALCYRVLVLVVICVYVIVA